MLKAEKIIVIGCSGAGKSTFSKQLSEMVNIPLFHLDTIYWRPDATHLNRAAFIRKQKKIMKNERWIIDGNYGATIEKRIKNCELVYFFDMPTELCLEGVFKRDKNRNDIACELEPNEELINYIKAYSEKSKPKVLKLFEKYPDVEVITFKSHTEVDNYLADLRREYGLNF